MPLQDSYGQTYETKPWVRGLVEALTGVKLVRASTLETRNRMALILLDSTLEIGFKNYLIYEKGISLEKTNLILQYREKLHKAARAGLLDSA